MRERSSTYLRNVVEPEVFDRLDAVFPELHLSRRGAGWQAGNAADALTHELWGVAARRVFCKSPGWFGIAGGDSVGVLEHAVGLAAPPGTLRGQAFERAVIRLAELAGVDTTPLEDRPISDTERAEIERRRREAAEHAARRRAEAEAEQAETDAKEIGKARAMVRAAQGSVDHPAVIAYLDGRGVPVSALPDGRVPESVLFGPSGFDGAATAMLGVVVTPGERGEEITGVQRILIDHHGRRQHVVIDGQRVRKAMCGRTMGGAVRLGALREGVPLVACEGLETGHAIHAATGWPVWCALSAAGLVNMIIPRRFLAAHGGPVSRLVIAADADRPDKNHNRCAGAYFADRAVDRWADEGLPAGLALPDAASAPGLADAAGLPVGERKSVDWLDVYAELGPERVRRAMEAAAPPPADTGPDVPERDDEPEHVLPDDELEIARLYMLESHAPAEHERPGSALHLVHLDGSFWRFDGRRHVELRDDRAVRGDVRRWSQPYFVRKVRRHKETPATPEQWAALTFYQRANLKRATVEAVKEAVADEVLVTRGEEFREQLWLHPHFSRAGTPRWERPAWERGIEDHAAAGLPDPERLVPFRNGLLDADRWIATGELVMHPHTPRLFNRYTLPVELPLDEARAALEGGEDDLEEWVDRELCPDWCRVLGHAFGGAGRTDVDVRDNSREMHKAFGAMLVFDKRYRQGSIVWLHGPAMTGKSTVLDVITAVLGIEAFVSSTMDKLTDPTHFAAWIGKRLAVFADADLGRGVDRRAVSEALKMLAVGDPMSIRQLYRDYVPNWRYRGGMAMAVNQMPALPDDTQAMPSRSLVFDFQNPVRTPDPNLTRGAARLLQPRALAGVALKLLLGLRHLEADGGFVQPVSSAAPLEDLRAMGGDMAEFLEDYVEVVNTPETGEVPWVSRKAVYEAYCKHLEELGRSHCPSDATFWASFVVLLVQAGWRRGPIVRGPRPDGRQRGYLGLRLSPAAGSLGTTEVTYDDPSGLPGLT